MLKHLTGESHEQAIAMEVEERGDMVAAMAIWQQALVEAMSGDLVRYPIHAAVLAANGCCQIYRCTAPGAQPVCLAEHEEPKGMLLPIHTLILDADGAISRIMMLPKRTTGN